MKTYTYYLKKVFQKINFFYWSIFFRKSHWMDEKKEILCDTRIPKEIVNGKSKNLIKNNKFDAGKRMVFETDSEWIALNGLYEERAILKNMTPQATSGMDIYVFDGIGEKDYCIYPEKNYSMRIRKTIPLNAGLKRIEIYFPSFAHVKYLKIGIANGSTIKKMNDERAPMIVYGSSISQGCAASRPSLNYANMLGRHYGIGIENYGFSESAFGEYEIIDFIASRRASLFLIEYDHNASVEVLKKTHLGVYQHIRNKQKDTPIIFMSRFSGGLSISGKEEDVRIAVINKTFQYAMDNGDDNIFFLCGKNKIKNKMKYFADDRHPNDRGMEMIANELIRIIDEGGLLKW